MRIAQIVPSLESRHGGPSVSVPAVSAGLAQIGHEVTLLATGRSGDAPEPEDRLTVRTFPRDWPASICPSSGLRKYLQKLSTDVVHSHGLWLRPLHYAHQLSRQRHVCHVISPRGMMAEWAWNHHRARKAFADRFIHPGALFAAQRRGWHVPGRLAIAGLGDLELADQAVPAISGARIPGYRMGQLAAQLVLRRLAGETVAPRIIDVGFTLAERASTVMRPAITE